MRAKEKEPQIMYTAQKAVVLSEDGKSILVSRYLTSIHLPEKLETKVCLPGGKMKPGQKPNESLIEEVEEETGITVKPSLPFYMWSWVYDRKGEIVQITAIARLAVYESGEIQPPKAQKETTMSKAWWLKIDDLENQLDEFVIDEQPIVEAFLKFREQNPFTPPY